MEGGGCLLSAGYDPVIPLSQRRNIVVTAWETPAVKKGGNATGQSCDTWT